MDAERACAEKIPLVFAVDQRPFKFQKDSGPVNRFCVLYPLMTIGGERVKPDRETFPHRGRVWWKLRDDIREELVVPGSLWTGAIEPARGSGRGRADDDVYQVCLRDIFPAGGELIQILQVREDDPDLERVLRETPLPWPEPVTPRVILQGWRTILGPLRATWRPETQDLIFAPLSPMQPEVLRVPIQEFFEHTRTERFQIELNAFDPQSELNRKTILLTRMDWLQLDRLRKLGEVLDGTSDAQLVSWAVGYLGLNQAQTAPLKQVLAQVQQRQVSFNGEIESRRLDRFHRIVQDADRVANLGADVARELAETPAFGDLVSRNIETVAQKQVAEAVQSRQAEIESAIQAKKRELEQIQATVAELAARQEAELQRRLADRIADLEERERTVEQQRKLLTDRQDEFIARLRREANEAGAAVLAQIPLLRALGLGGEARNPAETIASREPIALPMPEFLRKPKPAGAEPLAESDFLAQLGRLIESRGYRFASEDLVNFHVCVKVGGLTVLVGARGIGKTSLPRLYAEALGCRDEFLPITVRPDWLDDRDLLGSFNVQAQRFEPAATGLVEHLIAASHDQSLNRGGIYMVCLDEMHLAPAESYLAPLLGLLDAPAEERFLALFAPGLVRPGDPYAPYRQLPVPENLRFVGTVDLDGTSDFFTPKLMDRCQVVALAAPDFAAPIRRPDETETVDLQPVTLTTYLGWSQPARFEGSVHTFLLEIDEILRPARLGLGYRQFQRILRYVQSAQPFFSEDTALDYQLRQVILPRLRSTTPRFGETVQALARLLVRDRFPRSADVLACILDARTENDYFRLL
jgi:hypothetical protein